MLLLPLVSLAALCAYAADLSLGNALTLNHVDVIGNHLAAPLGRAVIALEDERRDATVETVAPGADTAGLQRTRAVSDKAVAAFLKETKDGDVRRAENGTVRAGVDNAVKALGSLTAIRQGVDAHKSSKADVLTAYTNINNSIAEALRRMTILPDQDAQDFGQALYTQVPAGDILSQEDALISAAAATPGRRLGAADYQVLVQDVGAQRLLNAQAVARLPAPQRAPFLKLAAPGGATARVAALEDRIIAAGPDARKLPFTIDEWRAAFDAEEKASSTIALDDISLVFTRTGPPARRAFVELILAGLLGLTALVVSIVMSVRMTRSLIGDIGRLRSASRNLTEDQLRDVVGRLRRGEAVDVEAGMTRQEFVNREMAELGAAFDALQATAVELAREDVRLHEGISQLFVNLARRSQVLIHRQLSMLDDMERHEEDARTLDRLFELDQLATRMRRYAEGLLIVSGASPGRFWRHPVPVVDVVRGGIAETEQYARVVVMPVPDIGIQGRAAADVIHLLAELIENAEVFSSADSEVRVAAGTAATGLVVEIDDRGLGMPPEELAAANERLASALEVSTLDSTRLGLVTVGRLAQRHGIEVTLRRSPYGGVSAVVLIPEELLERDPAALGAPGGALPPGGATGEAGAGQAGQAGSAQAEPGPAEAGRAGAGRGVPRQGDARGAAARPAGGARGAGPVTAGSVTAGSGAGRNAQGLGGRLPGGHHPGNPGGRPLGEGNPGGPPRGGTGARQPYVGPLARRPASPTDVPAWSGMRGVDPARPATGSGRPATGSAPVPGRAPAPAGPPAGFPEGDTIDGLPRRVPQASLANEMANEAAAAARGQLMDWDNSGQDQHGYVGGIGWGGGARTQDPAGPGATGPTGATGAAGRGAVPGVRPYPEGLPYGGTGGYAEGPSYGGTSPYPESRPPGGRRVPVPEPQNPADRPERVRSMMSALQAGAARARVGQYAEPDDGGGRTPGGDRGTGGSDVHLSPRKQG
ncbi:nitrate- and nitrite sensing domain-containing protein [Streptomyces sp. NPDC008150]|uniref:sensor histidine kinase n=1 Tax=Streptomyces sp. NPDC008150 TaxID=3364816 RepID=UPI0036EC16F0